jgi:hypothetical protein
MKKEGMWLNVLLVVVVGLFIGCTAVDDIDDYVRLSPGVGSSTVITLPDGSSSRVTFSSHAGTKWCYAVTELSGKDLSHWVLAIECHATGNHIISTSPAGTIGTDGPTGYTGVKWDASASFTSGTFCITLDDNYAEGSVTVVAKAGDDYDTGSLPGPSCVLHDQGGGG